MEMKYLDEEGASILAKDCRVWQDMAGDTELEKKINSYLTAMFINWKDVPVDECLDSAKDIIAIFEEHSGKSSVRRGW